MCSLKKINIIYQIQLYILFGRYYNLTDSGCTLCGCDADGSTGGLCDKEFGICTCKTMVQGEKCDECPTGEHKIVIESLSHDVY